VIDVDDTQIRIKDSNDVLEKLSRPAGVGPFQLTDEYQVAPAKGAYLGSDEISSNRLSCFAIATTTKSIWSQARSDTPPDDP
jgi:hypothetical protein